MNLYYAVAIFFQLFHAFISNEKYRAAYMLYLWKSMPMFEQPVKPNCHHFDLNDQFKEAAIKADRSAV
jgi:hypothetical protein